MNQQLSRSDQDAREAGPAPSRAGTLKNGLFHGAGLAVLALASLRHRFGGYRRPTDFPSSDWPRAITHVLDIVEDWDRALGTLGRDPRGWSGADVLELGPGASLGTGLLLAGRGIRSYRAIDLFPLAAATPAGFYRALAETAPPQRFDRAAIRAAADAMEKGTPGPVAYATDPDFDLVRAAAGEHYDVIVSNAAFEHFADIDRVIAQAAALARPGAAFVAMVDFQTHSRIVRQADPNGIYRYDERLYRALAFPGQPNRRRPDDYLAALARHGWEAAEIRPVATAGPDYLAWSRAGLARSFARPGARMDILTGIVLARRR